MMLGLDFGLLSPKDLVGDLCEAGVEMAAAVLGSKNRLSGLARQGSELGPSSGDLSFCG